MVHKAEINFTLNLSKKSISDLLILSSFSEFDVVFVRLPNIFAENKELMFDRKTFKNTLLFTICKIIRYVGSRLNESTKYLILGEPAVLPFVHSFLEDQFSFRNWIAIRLTEQSIEGEFLKNEHMGLLLYTKEKSPLKHSILRIGYEYCKFCDKTTKDYGGKKHLYHSYGTLVSDVWKDIAVSKYDEIPQEVIYRIRDLFSIYPNKNMLVTSLWDIQQNSYNTIDCDIPDSVFPSIQKEIHMQRHGQNPRNMLLLGDAIDQLRKIGSSSVDMVFVDPPYNLSKKYEGYSDRLDKEEYYSWCNKWLDELSRVLKPGGSLFVVNIPYNTIRYFLYLKEKLQFQNWIVWDSLSNPVRHIMPAHYSILYFTKGLIPKSFNYNDILMNESLKNDENCQPINYGFCLRDSCIKKRNRSGIITIKELTDLWTDIHRIKHNSLRVDHPTLLPPKLLKRLILLSSKENDVILDCFNGVGTTTLIAEHLKRDYIGIEKNPSYYQISLKRHKALKSGKGVFIKRKIIPKVKNSNIARVKVRSYKVPKRILQLEVREISCKLGRLATREDLIKLSKYPIEYFDNYFRNWSEVLAAAKTTGMSEQRSSQINENLKLSQFLQ